MVVAAKDHLTVVDQALHAFNQALEPKKVEILPGGHFDAYVEPDFARASAAARDWFASTLPINASQVGPFCSAGLSE